MRPQIGEIKFEAKDTEIFKIADTKTRISTVQNYFFPRLEILLRQTLELIKEIYNVNPYDKMTFVYYPNNRKKARQSADLQYVHIGLSGKRKIGRNLAFNRENGKPFQFHPTYLTYNIYFDGSICVELMPFRQNVSSDFISAVGELYKENFANLSSLFALCHISHSRTSQFVDMENAFVGQKDEVKYIYFYSPTYYFPVDIDKGLERLMLCFAAFYPLLDSFNAIGEGESPELAEMLIKFKNWWLTLEDTEARDLEIDNKVEEVDLPKLESYSFVRAGLWWSVLARDNWTCCSCGRSSKEEGIILEVDHIIPRSKGGSDDIGNLQTLCKKCNIGKSNKDMTDLRRSANIT